MLQGCVNGLKKAAIWYCDVLYGSKIMVNICGETVQKLDVLGFPMGFRFRSSNYYSEEDDDEIGMDTDDESCYKGSEDQDSVVVSRVSKVDWPSRPSMDFKTTIESRRAKKNKGVGHSARRTNNTFNKPRQRETIEHELPKIEYKHYPYSSSTTSSHDESSPSNYSTPSSTLASSKNGPSRTQSRRYNPYSRKAQRSNTPSPSPHLGSSSLNASSQPSPRHQNYHKDLATTIITITPLIRKCVDYFLATGRGNVTVFLSNWSVWVNENAPNIHPLWAAGNMKISKDTFDGLMGSWSVTIMNAAAAGAQTVTFGLDANGDWEDTVYFW
ncbi:hypothetical protein HDU76_004723 [Blyttiomyces sp. JEL0837]|nr:hypothetical protein HDU76_004723 [Blyttiomyces sp. JEL0837]